MENVLKEGRGGKEKTSESAGVESVRAYSAVLRGCLRYGQSGLASQLYARLEKRVGIGGELREVEQSATATYLQVVCSLVCVCLSSCRCTYTVLSTRSKPSPTETYICIYICTHTSTQTLALDPTPVSLTRAHELLTHLICESFVVGDLLRLCAMIRPKDEERTCAIIHESYHTKSAHCTTVGVCYESLVRAMCQSCVT